MYELNNNVNKFPALKYIQNIYVNFIIARLEKLQISVVGSILFYVDCRFIIQMHVDPNIYSKISNKQCSVDFEIAGHQNPPLL